jgi:UDP-glucose 4-epimerase
MILVTGATGFLGSALVRALNSRNIPTRCVSSRPHQTANANIAEYAQVDLCEVDPRSDIFDGIDTIIHLASTTIPATSMTDMVYDAESNLGMALRLLEATRIRGIKNFIFASSGGTVYGDPIRLPVRETDPTEPRSSYGIIKLAIEKYIGLYSRLYGLRGISLRISNPYGIGQLSGVPVGLIARILKDVHQRKRFSVWGNGTVVRDYFHINDLNGAFLIAVRSDLPTGVYNIAGGHGTSIREIVALVESITGQPVRIDYQPARNIDVPKIWLDTEKFRSATGWQPMIDLKDGVRGLWQDLLMSSPSETTE